jgi:hypothetical protein
MLWTDRGPLGVKEDGMLRVDSRIVMLVLLAIIGVPDSGVAGVRKCASHALNREDAAAAGAAARAGLPRSVRPFIAGACWNPDNATASIETRKSTQRNGVKQWWELECRREESVAWHCPAEFKQMIRLPLSIGDKARIMDLSFSKDISLERARELATRAISIYEDRTVDLHDCVTGDVMDLRQGSRLPTGSHPIRVTVDRESGAESAYLNDVDLSFNVPTVANDDPGQVSCWSLWVVVG